MYHRLTFAIALSPLCFANGNRFVPRALERTMGPQAESLHSLFLTVAIKHLPCSILKAFMFFDLFAFT